MISTQYKTQWYPHNTKHNDKNYKHKAQWYPHNKGWVKKLLFCEFLVGISLEKVLHSFQ